MNTSLEWAVAWSLVGEWTTPTIFLPPKGEWPRQGHPQNLLSPYDQRSVPMLTWARACFEQGSLPSLLALPGDASLMVLPGDGMFQAQRIVNGKCRPVILHGYGGAKKEMRTSLADLAKSGWAPMAAAMVGSASSPPLWTGQDWRPILGTSVDTRILPPHLSNKEAYSCSVSGFASHGMIYTSDTPLTAGCLLTKSTFPLVLIVIPHRIPFERSLDLSIPYIDMLLGPPKPARGTALEESPDRDYRTPCSGRSAGDAAIAGGQLSSIRCQP